MKNKLMIGERAILGQIPDESMVVDMMGGKQLVAEMIAAFLSKAQKYGLVAHPKMGTNGILSSPSTETFATFAFMSRENALVSIYLPRACFISVPNPATEARVVFQRVPTVSMLWGQDRKERATAYNDDLVTLMKKFEVGAIGLKGAVTKSSPKDGLVLVRFDLGFELELPVLCFDFV